MKYELYHHGIKGQKWGVRRFQNEDGSLTAEGEKRYSESLSSVYGDDGDEDYAISKGTSIFRRTSSLKDDDTGERKYAYTYDYDDPTDDNFYKQFGKRVTEYTVADDAVLAGRRTLGKAFAERMLELDDENDIAAMRSVYRGTQRRLGEAYVSDLFKLPYEPSKHIEALEKAGADMVARMLSFPRNEMADEEMRYEGKRDRDTAANDIGRSIVDRLLADGYSGLRDYNDYGSAAGVHTPTVVFDPGKTLSRTRSWIED